MRLTNSNKLDLKTAISSLEQSEGLEVICAGYESRSIKRQKDVTPHVHVLIATSLNKIKLNRAANQLGYKGGHGEKSYNVTQSKGELNYALSYHCKGDMQGKYEVDILDPSAAESKHVEWHTRHAEIAAERQKKVPLYQRVVNEIILNIHDYEGRGMEDGTVRLNKEKIVKRIISAYAEADIWFKSDSIEKTYNLLAAKIDVDRILNANSIRLENFSDIYIDGKSNTA